MKGPVTVPNVPDLSHLTRPPLGIVRYGTADKDQAKKLNRAIAVTALDLVFSLKADTGIARLVEKYQHDAVRLHHKAFTAPSGEFLTLHSTYLGKKA